ncbi:translocation protein TolB [Mariprofundus micogutta]|uniref:Translocation protein TolB n=1 Tax=Mariprofundus micogutta TaxID=1921010 RepID=A0A1L8CJT7_9PROT|nr:PD40 domain-containing protein [Mariprofundus micogutta]GAV19129.1 translocation protein TolB [Mariprofundus micogutta]
MKRLLSLIALLLLATPVSAADLLDWLEEVSQAESATASTQERVVTQKVNLLTLEGGEAEMYPRISPDGKYLLVQSGKRNKSVITRRMLENGDVLNVITDDALAFDSFAWHGNEQVVFLSERGGNLGLWSIASDSQGAVRRTHRLIGDFIQPIVLNDDSIIAVQPAAKKRRHSSYRGKSAAFNFSNWKPSKGETRLLHIQDTGAINGLAAGINPSLSPDGKRIVFSMQAGESWHLFMMNTDGSELVQLTNDHSIDVQPTWSPDGQWIAFTSNRGDIRANHGNKMNWDIWMIHHDGRNLTRLTRDEARDGGAAIAANGRLYFHSDRKVQKQEREQHGVKGSTSGFHIWSVALPVDVIGEL